MSFLFFVQTPLPLSELLLISTSSGRDPWRPAEGLGEEDTVEEGTEVAGLASTTVEGGGGGRVEGRRTGSIS